MPDIHDGSKSAFIKAVTNEWVLFLNRFVLSGCALLMTWWVMDLKTETKEMRKDFNISLLVNEARISKVEGQMSVFDNAMRMQTKSIETHETTIQSLWSRIFDMNMRIPPPKVTP